MVVNSLGHIIYSAVFLHDIASTTDSFADCNSHMDCDNVDNIILFFSQDANSYVSDSMEYATWTADQGCGKGKEKKFKEAA